MLCHGSPRCSIQYLYTTLNSDLRLLFLCVILGITGWTSLCHLLRGEVLKLREADYVQAATAFGVRHGTIMLRHLVPNVMLMIGDILEEGMIARRTRGLPVPLPRFSRCMIH